MDPSSRPSQTKRCIIYWDKDSAEPARTTAGWKCGELYVCDDDTHKLSLSMDTSAGLVKAMQNLEEDPFWRDKDAI